MRTVKIVALLILILSGVSAEAYHRFVVVNGVLMTPQQLQYLDLVAGEPVPDGRYWLNTYTGEWGYEGGPVQGVLGTQSDAQWAGRRQLEPATSTRVSASTSIETPR